MKWSDRTVRGVNQLPTTLEQTGTYVRVYSHKLPTAQQTAVVYSLALVEYKAVILCAKMYHIRTIFAVAFRVKGHKKPKYVNFGSVTANRH
jgi:hypothetical protein